MSIAKATRTLCNTCRIRLEHTSGFAIRSTCIACPNLRTFQTSIFRRMSSVAVRHGFTSFNADYERSPLHYSEEQLQALYSDLFASLPSATQPTEDFGEESSLQTLQERFQLDPSDLPHRAVIDHVNQALALATGTELQLGLVLDSEWEIILKSALDTGDLEYALKGLDVMENYNAGLIENLDLRLLNHPHLMQNIDNFSQFNDKLTQVGYPDTPERLSCFINSHLHSHPHNQPPMPLIKSTQDLIHKLEAQGTPPSQTAYISVIRAYLDVSRDSSLLSETSGPASTNPSAAIAAIHDLFTHMRYVAHSIPSLEAYSLVISACGRGGQVNPLRALELVQEIRQGLMSGRTEFTRPQVDVRSLLACYNGAIRACARAGPKFAGDAFRLAKELVQPDGIPVAGAAINGVGPDRKTMAALMHSAKRMGDLPRTRWILTEVIRAQGKVLGETQFANSSEAILDEEIMVCAFQVYSAFRPPFRREMVRERNEQQVTTAPAERPATPTQPISAYTIPQSALDVLKEADALFSRILSKRSASPDLLFTHVPISPRIVNAYLSIYFSHASLERALAKFTEVYVSRVLAEPNAYTFVNLFERLSHAAEPDRQMALDKAKETWVNWQNWIRRAESGELDPTLAEVTPRAIERVWAAIIRVHSLCDDIDTALALLREFVKKYPPTSLKHQHPPSPPTYRSHLECPPPAHSNKSLSTLLTTPAPRVELLVRFTTPEQITEPGVGPHLLFTDLALLHQRLVSRHSHRRDDIVFLTWACKSYEFQLKRRREQALGVLKPPHSERKLTGNGSTGHSSPH